MGRSRRLTGLAHALVLLLGCGHQSPPPSAPEATPNRAVSSAPSPRPPTTALAIDATYGDLVRAAGALDSTPRTPRGCLVAKRAGGFALEADLAPAVRPLPMPPDELDDALKATASVDILSAWGRYGDGHGTLALAGFTDSAPTRVASALVITDRGVHIRPQSGGTGASFDARDLPTALAQLAPNAERSWFVAAESGVALGHVVDVLAALGERDFKVVLAVPLARGTQIPLPSAAQVARCPDGLPETSAPEGSLAVQTLSASVAPLRTSAQACLGQGDARGAAGGRVAIALRVDANGSVQAACATRDELGDPGVLACVLDLARRLTFPPPSPSGVLDIVLPVALLPGSRPVQRPLCTDS